MAKFLPSGNISSIYGSVGGHTYSRTAGGAVIKRRPKGVNPSTPKQSSQRQLLASISSAWQSLSASQRTAWISAAPSWPHTDGFGNNSPLTGHALFCSLNLNLVQVGSARITSPPSIATLPTQLFQAVFNRGISAFYVQSTPVAPAAPWCILVDASPGLSPGVSYVRSRLRYMNHGASASQTCTFWNEFITAYGSIPAAGRKVILRVCFVNTATGQASPYTYIAVILT